MKSMKFLLISLLSLSAIANANACWYPCYTPGGYYMYRVCDNRSERPSDSDGIHPETARNCVSWQQQTSPKIPLQDIYDIVYAMPLKEFEAIYDNRKATYKNKFAEWITKNDPEILDFLLLAKTNEHIRLKRNSRWYYPSTKIDARMPLEGIAEKSLSMKGSKFHDRYLLQGIRALFSLAKYRECIDVWESEASALPEDNLMRELIKPYIAGAEFRLRNTEKAITYFAQIGDIRSILFCAGRTDEKLSTVDALTLVCEYAPDSPYIPKTLESCISSWEPLGEFGYPDHFEPTEEYHKLYSLCLKMANDKNSGTPAMWYYTAAFLSDLNGETSKASRLLTLAEQAPSTAFLDESIAVFRIYLDAKTHPYNNSYENKLFTQLRWLDSQITAHIDDRVRNEITQGYKLLYGESFYYWNDMMRRILLAEVCPRMLKAGKTTRALQLANMADNRLLGIVNKQKIHSTTESFTIREYRLYRTSRPRYFNIYDYSNHFFEMIDSLGVDAAVRYVCNIKKPATEFDRFLNARGYTGDDYLNDIVGTQYLRNMEYGNAVKYLSAISAAYENHHNLIMDYDPFSVERRPLQDTSAFKLAFAKEMYTLECAMKTATDPNHKACLMVKYAIGIRNSFDRCWPLTQYYKGTCYRTQVCEKREWETDRYTTAAIAKVKSLVARASRIVTDDETGAELHYELCNFLTVATRYPDTPQGLLVKGSCDNLIDYHAESYSPAANK